MRHPQPRFDATTGHLLDTADRVIIEHGLRELSLEMVSTEGFASTGSVYERWKSKWNLIDDLIDQRFEPHWERLVEYSEELSLTRRLQRFESSAIGHVVGTWIVELLHMARVRPESLPRVRTTLDRLANWFLAESSSSPSHSTAEDPASRGARWWLVAVTIGSHQLRIGGAVIPPLAEHLAALSSPEPPERRSPSTDVALDQVPGTVAPPSPDIDDVSRRIVGVTRDLLAQSSGHLSMRSILGRSNVSSTTLYRRFESKRQLLLGVLHEELSTASYEWVLELVDSLGSDDPIDAMAAVFRRRFDTLTEFPDTRNVILELTAQARRDPDLRRTLIDQVVRMAELRTELFVRLAAAGVVDTTIPSAVPGWLIQTAPAGYRLVVGAGIPVDGDDMQAATARVFWKLLRI